MITIKAQMISVKGKKLRKFLFGYLDIIITNQNNFHKIQETDFFMMFSEEILYY